MNNADKKIKSKKRLKNTLSFVVILIFILASFFAYIRFIGVSNVDIAQYYMGENKKINTEKPGTIDVLFLGSSHCWDSYNPQVLWDEYGYTSYNLGGSRQTPIASYYLLQDALVYQKDIKCVVMDSFYIIYFAKYRNAPDQELDNFKCFSSTYWRKKYIDDVYNRQDWMQQYTKEDFYYNTYWNHNSWKNLYQYNFASLDNRFFTSCKGFTFNFNATNNNKYTKPDCSAFETDNRSPVDEVYMEYTQKIIDLCKSKGIQLLFTETPYLFKDIYWQARCNTLVDHLTQQGVAYISSNTEERFSDIDFATFFMNKDHLNALGAESETLFVGKYLHDNFDLQDRRGDKKYKDFDKGFDLLRRNLENCKINVHIEIDKILEQTLSQDGYIVIVVGNGNYPVWYTSRTYIAEIGITVPPEDDKRPFYGVYTQQQGLLCNQTFTDATTNYRKEILGDRVCIDLMGNGFEVRVNDYVIHAESDKAVMIVYDTVNDIPAIIRYLY